MAARRRIGPDGEREMRRQDVGRMREALNALDRRANERLGTFDAHSIGLGRYVPGSSPWERHHNGDELLFVTDGDVSIEVIDGVGGSHVEALAAGSLFVVPKGLWHRLTATVHVNILYISPGEEGAERTQERPLAAGRDPA
jgi:mannose-6-phosphate isomerase-like protein (cupin superfamily)